MLYELGMAIGTESLLMASIAVLTIYLCLVAVFISPVQSVFFPYLVAVCTVSLFMTDAAFIHILFGFFVVYTEPVAVMRFGTGMAVVAEILMMTVFTGILILLNIQLMSFNPLGIKCRRFSLAQRNVTGATFVRRLLAVMTFAAGGH